MEEFLHKRASKTHVVNYVVSCLVAFLMNAAFQDMAFNRKQPSIEGGVLVDNPLKTSFIAEE